jgi:hypothetical protein
MRVRRKLAARVRHTNKPAAAAAAADAAADARWEFCCSPQPDPRQQLHKINTLPFQTITTIPFQTITTIPFQIYTIGLLMALMGGAA